jgi:hypothetical protein
MGAIAKRRCSILVVFSSIAVALTLSPASDLRSFRLIAAHFSFLQMTGFLRGRQEIDDAILQRAGAAQCRPTPSSIGATSAFEVFVCPTIGGLFLGTINLSLYLYTAELYPTRIRAFASSIARA